MATRSYIGYLEGPDTVKFVYCHLNGFFNGPWGVGYILPKYYNSYQAAKKLILQGDIHFLGNKYAKDIEDFSLEREDLNKLAKGGYTVYDKYTHSLKGFDNFNIHTAKVSLKKYLIMPDKTMIAQRFLFLRKGDEVFDKIISKDGWFYFDAKKKQLKRVPKV